MAIEFRVYMVSQECLMAPVRSLTGRHLSIICLDVVMRCDIGLSHLD